MTLSKEQSMLLDMWNEKHIQILKEKLSRQENFNMILDSNVYYDEKPDGLFHRQSHVVGNRLYLDVWCWQ